MAESHLMVSQLSTCKVICCEAGREGGTRCLGKWKQDYQRNTAGLLGRVEPTGSL